MKTYERKYKLLVPGPYVIIRDNKVEILSDRYDTNVLAEMYFHEIEIDPVYMNVTMKAITGEPLSVIWNARRITDIRTDDHE